MLHRLYRVEAGSREDMLDLIFDAWRADTADGRTSLMLAADSQTVADLNARACHHRITTGQVFKDREITLADQSRVGVRDLVVTRHNHRDLAVAGSKAGWVKNGDEWTVQAVGKNGSLTIRRHAGTAVTVLPPGYVAQHLELGNATTAHRAQGRTVDTAHAYLSTSTVRESLYVMATRPRDQQALPRHKLRPTPRPHTRNLRRAFQATSSAASSPPGADTSAHETRAAEEGAYTSPTTTRRRKRRSPCQAAEGARPTMGYKPATMASFSPHPQHHL